MVGKLVTAESVVRDHPAISDSIDPLLSRNLGQLTRVIQEIRKTSMSMRIVVAGTMFRKMNRLTRDLARKSGKIIELITAGDDLELDRSIVEGLADPIMHMIRNAVDHGLEMPDERRRVGKPEKGIIRLQAMQDAGEIAIEISDDGRGMDPQRILAKAERLGMVDRGETLDEESIFRFIFEPGFSTVEKVTEISGRGVGMDLVEKQIRKLRGHIEIRSTRGKAARSCFGCRVVREMLRGGRFPEQAAARGLAFRTETSMKNRLPLCREVRHTGFENLHFRRQRCSFQTEKVCRRGLVAARS